MDESQAIEHLRRGGFDGLAWLVERFQLRALRTAFLVTGERRLAEDIVQEHFLALPRAIRSFDISRPFEPWFLRGVINSALSALGRGKKVVEFSDVLDEGWLEKLPTALSTEEHVQNRELERTVWAELQKLGAVQRAAIVMHYYLGMSETEMAERMDVPAGTVKWRLSAARGKLRRGLGSDPRKEDGK